jgi:putative DNA primase/helicase
MRGDPVEKVLSRLENVKKYGTSFTARCPVHDDQHPSLSIGIGDDGCALLKCHAGCPT